MPISLKNATSILSWIRYSPQENIPEKHRGKRPSEGEWQRTVGMPLYRDVAQNTGVLTGKVYPLDIDIEDAAIVTEIVAMTEKLFGRTSVRCRQNSPRRLLPNVEDGWNRKGLIGENGVKKEAFSVLAGFYAEMRDREGRGLAPGQ